MNDSKIIITIIIIKYIYIKKVLQYFSTVEACCIYIERCQEITGRILMQDWVCHNHLIILGLFISFFILWVYILILGFCSVYLRIVRRFTS